MNKKFSLLLSFSICILLLTFLCSVGIGTVHVSWKEILHILLSKCGFSSTVSWTQVTETIIWYVRIPRVLIGVFVGAALALAGACFQGVLQNSLAEPYTLGVASGASVGAAIIIFLGKFELGWILPLSAFITSLATLAAVLLLSRQDNHMPTHILILSGVVIQAFLGAFVSLLISLSQQNMNEILLWTMGSLAMKTWEYLLILVPCTLIGGAILFSYGRALNLLTLGEKQAEHLGLNTFYTKIIILFFATLLTAAAVATSGVIGFVGLVVPHLVRLSIGPDYRYILPLSCVGGAIYLVWADTLARTMISPIEIPLGVLTAFLGAPFFIFLLVRNKKMKRGYRA